MRTVVIYPGRFHPFHRGHKASYDYLTRRFGENNVFIATSPTTAPITSPFSYSDKVTMMSKLGIPVGRIAQVASPYQAKEITSQIDDKENTILIFAVSEKDMQGDESRFKFGVKKDGSPSYLQPYPANGKNLKPMSKHAYVMVTPTVNFRVKGADANSASQIRKLYIDGNDQDRNKIIADLYGEVDPELKDIFDQRLGLVQKTQTTVAEARNNPQHAGKLLHLLSSIKKLESQANLIEYEDLAPDFVIEKLS
jgi:hypothetical protein